MRIAFAVVLLAAGLLWAGCASAGSAEDFKWSIECPRSVDKGAEFTFTVQTANEAGSAVDGVKYRYQILWTAGSSSPLRHKGRSGEPQKIHARMVAGPATIVVTCENRAGLDTKVLESGFEVK